MLLRSEEAAPYTIVNGGDCAYTDKPDKKLGITIAIEWNVQLNETYNPVPPDCTSLAEEFLLRANIYQPQPGAHY